MMLSGAVLSGGKSSRMGRDKGLIKLGGRPLADHVAKTLTEVADEVLISVAKGKSVEYQRVLEDEFVVLEDDAEGLGPLEGLITSLSAAKGDYVLFSPCDTPFLRTEVCRTTALHAIGRDGAVPVVRGYQEPLHAVYRRGVALEAFKKTLKKGNRRPTDAYGMLDLVSVPETVLRKADPHLVSFWNLNSPEDLKLAEERMKKDMF